MKELYYAHSMATYGTRKERQELQRIRKRFPDHKIINPAEIELTGDGTKKMQTCVDVVKQANVLVLSEYRKHIGRGVAVELETAVEENIKRYLLRGRKFIDKFTSIAVDPNDWKIRYARIVET